MILLVLAFYVHTVSTSVVDLNASENAVMVLKNDVSQREILVIDPTLLFSQPKEKSISLESDNNDLSDTSSDIVRQIFGNNKEPESRNWADDSPHLDHLDYLKRAKVQPENGTVYLSAPGYPTHRQSILRNAASKSLPFLSNHNNLNGSASFKKFKDPAPVKNITKFILPSSLDALISLDQSVSDDVSTNLSNFESMKAQKQVQGKRTALDPQHWSSNDSDPSDLLIYLKRSKRQVVNKTDALSELPRWSGMPQGILRQAQMSTAHVKRKILAMMLQSLYSAQERLWPLGPIVRKYEHLTPYRMAFIFMKLDQLVHEGHSIYMYLQRQVINPEMTITRRLQLYSQIMRRNIDVTYLVDYIMERVPRDQVVRIRQWVIRHEQQDILEKKVAWDKSLATRYIQRPDH